MVLHVLALGLLLGASAPATTTSECKVPELRKKLASSSPGETPSLYLTLAECDPIVARELAPESFKKMLGGPQSVKAAIAGIKVGASQDVRAWMEILFAEERSQVMLELGRSCEKSPFVVPFFAETSVIMGENFWKDRWQRGLAECHDPAAQELMRKALQDPIVQQDASRYASILESLCRNMGPEAIPWLKAIILTAEEGNRRYVLDAFQDAAGLGSLAGADPKALADAVAAIVEVSQALSPALIDHARQVVSALGDGEAARGLAGQRYSKNRRPGGEMVWGVIAVEKGACKNGKSLMATYTGQVSESGHYWPDQLRPALETALKSAWVMDAAVKCKGESTVDVLISDEPLDQAALDAWTRAQIAELTRRPADKLSTAAMPEIRLP